MKNQTPSAAPRRALFWPVLALVSLAANAALGIWVWRASRPTVPEARPAAPAAAKPAPAMAARELGPYAALGSYMAENNRIADLGWTKEQFAAFQDGFRASYEGRGLPLDEDAKKLRDEISARVQKMLGAEQPNPVEDYFRQLREKEHVLKTASGLHYRITEPGTGPKAGATDTVVLSFSARLPDGTALPDFSRARTRMAVRDLLPGLAEGVQLLSVGGKALMYLPPSLAFSERDWPAEIPRGMPIAFFVELHEIVAAGK
jgi:FKBP-type peptidyl-prolyl cis-trans isomerase FkpA